MQSKFKVGEPVRIKETSSLNPNASGTIIGQLANDDTKLFVHVKDRGMVAINKDKLFSTKAEF